MPQDLCWRNKDENVHQPLCIDYPNVTSGIRELSAKTYIKCSQIHKSIQSDNNEISKGKLNSSQQDREGKTPYVPTILTKTVIHQDRDISRTRERERDYTHSYWYKPLARRVDYSLLIVFAAGMMKMATGDDFRFSTRYSGSSRWGFH